MSNYQNVSSFCQKMTDDSIDIRPNCSEIIANKNLWYFNGENLNLNDLRIFFNLRKTYLHNILESKLMDSIGVRNYLTSIYNFKINNSALLSLSHLDVRMESIFDLHDEKLIDIANGWNHATALSQSGKVYTWERHSYGDVGEMIRNDYFKLELNEFLSEKCIIEIKCGCKHSLALTKSGEVYAWSPNGSINLGNDSQNNGKPVKINGFDEEKVKMISCGLHHSLALTENGHVYSWGANVFGQLGVHSKNHTFEYFDGFVVEHSGFELTPRKVNIPNVFIQKVSCGSGHSLLLSTEGDIYVFGNNDKVQLGNLLLRELSPPFKLNSSRKYSEIASHPFHSFSVALSENNNYYIWGKFGSKVYERPTKTDFSSLDKIYAKCFMRTKKFDQIMNYIF
jgi:alpha-tubulin suppressor-like RCC1 family protein